MASKITDSEWKILIVGAGIIDVIQWILALTGIGIVPDEVLDPIIGTTIAGYLAKRGVSLFKYPNRFAALVGGTLAEMVAVSIPPAWILDMWYIRSDVKKEEVESQAEKNEQEYLQSGRPRSLYSGGEGRVRSEDAETDEQEYTREGVGRPRGNIRPLPGLTIGQTKEKSEQSFSA